MELVVFIIGNLTYVPPTILCSNSLINVIIASVNMSPSIRNPSLLSACTGYKNLPLETLKLEDIGASGEIAPDFGFIYPQISFLWISDNFIESLLPTSVCSTWTALTDITIFMPSNSFTGTIPDCYLNGTLSTQKLILNNNYLTGTLPSGFSSIMQLIVNNNFLTGTISISTGKFSNLLYLYLNENSFSGSLPTSFVSTSLYSLTLNSNRFSGRLPTLSSLNLFQYIAYNNFFSGTIPLVSNSFMLSCLSIGDNFLSGQINGNLTLKLRRLETIDFSTNKLTGAIPSELFHSTPSLQSFSANNNCLNPSIPDSICQPKTLQSLAINGISRKCKGDNSFSLYFQSTYGYLPSCLWNLPNLQSLSFVGNAMTGNYFDISFLLSQSF